ncbi:MAG TPA: sulfite exporter TauE/SafE family protein [Burkholderiales bacterium]|nr:sulfite exporter TauE/SafE family protein [Burkholderiales bacterium]
MEFITDPWFYAVAIPTMLLVGISKGGLGLAGGLSVPLLSLVISPFQAAAIMLPILIVMDLSAFLAYRRHWDRAQMRVLLPAGIVGIVVGAFVFSLLNEDWIRVLIGVIAVGFVLHSLRKAVRVRPATNAKGFFWGGVAGFTSFVAHAGAPPLSVYLLPQRLDPAVLVGTSVMFFTVINLGKLVPYAALGLLTVHNLSTSLLLAPLGALGIVLGIWLRTRISTQLFYRLSYGLLLLTGSKLIHDGVGNLL